MDLRLVGTDHNLAPIDARERLAVPRDRVPEVLRRVIEEGWASEAMLVSTCNRTELYAVSSAPDAGERSLRAFLAATPSAPPDAEAYLRVRDGEAAAEHLLRVATGLESAILGETEVQGQVRTAIEAAEKSGTAGKVLGRLAQAALKAGKRARSETAVSAGGVSHGSAAAEVSRRVFGSLKDRVVLVVGAGEMATQTARALASLGGGRFLVANRTRERAEVLAKDLGGAEVHGIEEVPALLAKAHVVVLAAESYSLGRREVGDALGRRRAPLLLVDLGLPRVVDPSAAHLPGVFLYSVEDLERLVAAALAVRREAVPAVEAIVADELGRLRTWHRALRVHPTLKSLNDWAEEIRRAEVGWLPEDLPPPVREAVDTLTKRLVQKLLGRPASRVVQGAETEDPTLPTAEHLKSVFGLGEGQDEAEDR